jgi:hypothetical protein
MTADIFLRSWTGLIVTLLVVEYWSLVAVVTRGSTWEGAPLVPKSGGSPGVGV